MKNAIFLFVLIVGFAWNSYGQRYTSIKGFVKNENLKEVSLYKTVDGSLQEYAKTKVAEDGSYGFVFAPEKAGFYTVGTDRISHILYAKGGEEVNMDIYAKNAKLTGKNTKENKALYQWEDFSEDIRLQGVYFMLSHTTYKEFFPALAETLEKLPAFRKTLRSGNKEFDELLQKKIDYDVDYCALMLLMTPRSAHPQKSDIPDWYKSIVSKDKFMTDDVLLFPLGIRMMGCYTSFALRESGMEYGTDNLLSFLGTDRLKGELVMSEARSYKSYDQYLEMMEKYSRYFVTPSLQSRAEAVGAKLYDTKAGGQAADFTYPDVNGKEVSLSDFKGKVVLVDVWATWCGPCRQQIPHLKKLEEEMHGTDVVFLGVSVDEAKDKQKWLDFIKKEGLGGIQLLASGWSKITKDYKIKGIPRFMVFDKKGNIVSVDAPRPSSPELKKMLEAELKK